MFPKRFEGKNSETIATVFRLCPRLFLRVELVLCNVADHVCVLNTCYTVRFQSLTTLEYVCVKCLISDVNRLKTVLACRKQFFKHRPLLFVKSAHSPFFFSLF